MNAQERKKFGFWVVVIVPLIFWYIAAKYTETLSKKINLRELFPLLLETPHKPWLLSALILGLVVGGLIAWYLNRDGNESFAGANFKKFLRGTKFETASTLKSKTLEKGIRQVTIAGIPMPTKVENLHLLVAGSTGSGKSVLIRELVFKAFLRKDRLIITDPNGDMVSKFYKEGDMILNPYDVRTSGWTFFNEIRNDFDFERYAFSLVPLGETKEAEEWSGYARLLLRETARKLSCMGNPCVNELRRLTTIASPDELKSFLAGTDAESLIVEGAERAFGSARFILSNKLPEHVNMPKGDFSLRSWLEDESAGNLFITWREDMAVALRPLISCWIDILCASILSLPENRERRLWMILDELASLDKLAGLEPALTKGRKAGLCVVAGLQSTSQLEDIYSRSEAQTLRACFRSLVVLGGSKTDPQTCEDLSKSLGEHEVERETETRNTGSSTTTSKRIETVRERVVLPSEIPSLPELSGYLAFSGDLPITRIRLEIIRFKERNPGFLDKHHAQQLETSC